MSRVILLVMDSLGVGESIDASDPLYNDQGANTLGHIAEDCAQRGKPLSIPNLQQLGLGYVAMASCGQQLPGLEPIDNIIGSYGYAVEQSIGKDTPSGHWEMMGLPMKTAWHLYENLTDSIDSVLLEQICTQADIPGFLGNKHASGTKIIEELGDESIISGKPIIYTSGDSVIQIAAHETAFGLERLYHLCEITRELTDDSVARIIARPFIGDSEAYKRTANRRDYSTPPPDKTLLDHLVEKKQTVISIGKIHDIFAGQGISECYKAEDNMGLFDATLQAMQEAATASLIFANFVDFDSCYGHRRDIVGYARALEEFDARLPELYDSLREDDIVMITADHGCDPSFPGSDHTREHVPILVYGAKIKANYLGRRETFADIGQTIAEYLNAPQLNYGVSFLNQASTPCIN